MYTHKCITVLCLFTAVCRFGLSTDSADVPLSKKPKVDDEVSAAAELTLQHVWCVPITVNLRTG